MATTTGRASAKSAPELTSLLQHMREVNRRAVRVVGEPFAGRRTSALRLHLAKELTELEKSVVVLRGLVADEAEAEERALVATRTLAPAVSQATAIASAWMLDSTAAMVKKGQLVPPELFRELMGWTTRQAVWKAVDSQRVFYIDHKAERYFPTFYADPAYVRKHLEAVTQVLADLPGGSKLEFFLTRKGSLGGETPLQALAAGRVDKVRDVAAGFAEVPLNA